MLWVSVAVLNFKRCSIGSQRRYLRTSDEYLYCGREYNLDGFDLCPADISRVTHCSPKTGSSVFRRRLYLVSDTVPHDANHAHVAECYDDSRNHE